MLLKALVEALTGKKMENPASINLDTNNSHSPNSQPPSSQSPSPQPSNEQPANVDTLVMTIDRYSEYELSEVSIQAELVNDDQQLININLSVSMERRFEATAIDLQITQGRLTDPLVINFNGDTVSLSNNRVSFDLNADGEQELIPTFNSDSGYLALDKNSDGKINNGTELFGPTTNNGFNELRTHDEDGNGFIDEGDGIFQSLSIWNPETDSLSSLEDNNISAIFTGYVDSPFRLTDNDNNTLGQVRSTGFYVSSDNSAGSVQQIDLAV